MKTGRHLRGIDAGLLRCNSCGLTMPVSETLCPCCKERVSVRTKHSFRNTTVLLFFALILFVCANFFPMLIFHKFGGSTPNTIIGGIKILFNAGMYSIAVIIFVASIVIPVFKITGLSFLLFSTRYCSPAYIRHHMVLYRFIERIGRWSMLDVFVISVMLSLLHFFPLVSITIKWGTSAFAAVVIITMLATITFDPRLLWDAVEQKEKKGELPHND